MVSIMVLLTSSGDEAKQGSGTYKEALSYLQLHAVLSPAFVLVPLIRNTINRILADFQPVATGKQRKKTFDPVIRHVRI